MSPLVTGQSARVAAVLAAAGAVWISPAAGAAGAAARGVAARRARPSRVRPVRLIAAVTLRGPAVASKLFTAPASFTFAGTVSPAEPGAIALLQRRDASTGYAWRRIAAAAVGLEGRYAITHTFLLVGGPVEIRVLVRGSRAYAASPSEIRTYEIAQPQNPRLTINASADPLYAGQEVVVSGAMRGAPRTAVTLLAHPVGHPGFVPVARSKTDIAGSYRFSAQAPPVNTYYEVAGDGRLSAELYEGVKRLAP